MEQVEEYEGDAASAADPAAGALKAKQISFVGGDVGWDSIVLARVKNRADLDDLTKTVFTLDGVTRSFTHVVLNTVKEDGLPRPAPLNNDE